MIPAASAASPIFFSVVVPAFVQMVAPSRSATVLDPENPSDALPISC